MRKAITLHIVNTLQSQVQEQPPNHHQLHPITPPSSGWKSPIPYLFGGLAAMLGLIAFALLILACSYWKLSGYQDNAAAEDTVDAASDEKPKDATTTAYLNSILVIMAGDEKPTFLATPATSRASSSSGGDGGGGSGDGGGEKEEKEMVVVVMDEDKR